MPLPRFNPGKGPPVPIVQEPGWAPEPVWTQRLEEKNSFLCCRSKLDRPVVQSVARQYTMYQSTWYFYLGNRNGTWKSWSRANKIVGATFSRITCSPSMNFENNTCTILNEWYEFKVLGKGMKCNDRFSLLGKFISIVSVIPASTVACEWGLGKTNVIKNNFRSAVAAQWRNSTLQRLWTTGISAPNVWGICTDIRESAISSAASLQRLRNLFNRQYTQLICA
jgi:hypothetical protein